MTYAVYADAGNGMQLFRSGISMIEAEELKRFLEQYVPHVEIVEAGKKAMSNPTLEQIAKEILGLETLETRMSDSKDFSDQAVWNLKSALAAAYEAGKKESDQGTFEELIDAATKRYFEGQGSIKDVKALLDRATAVLRENK